jgi:hypothetical protein
MTTGNKDAVLVLRRLLRCLLARLAELRSESERTYGVRM